MKRRLSLGVALLMFPLLTGGCGFFLLLGGAAAGAGALIWSKGWISEPFSEPIERVHRAAKAALTDYKVILEDDKLDPTYGFLAGRLPNDRRVEVRSKKLGEKSTSVKIRVGLWGDQQMPIRIFERMKKHL